jgi:hypothetical protein
VRAWRGDTELPLGPPKQRALLALLLTDAGQPMAVHEIVDALWGQEPPDSAVNVVLLSCTKPNMSWASLSSLPGMWTSDATAGPRFCARRMR